MHVRLSAAWTDSLGTIWAPGDTVDVDAVTLASLEELGMVETPDGQGTAPDQDTSKSPTSPGPSPDPKKIGPGPGAPPVDRSTK